MVALILRQTSLQSLDEELKDRDFRLSLVIPYKDDECPHIHALLEYKDAEALLGTVVLDEFSTISTDIEKAQKYEHCFGVRRRADAEARDFYMQQRFRHEIDLRAKRRKGEMD